MRDICLADAWYLFGELTRDDLWSFLRKLVFCPVSKDASALLRLVQRQVEYESKREYRWAKGVIAGEFFSRVERCDKQVHKTMESLCVVIEGNDSLRIKQLAGLTISLFQSRRIKGREIRGLVKDSCTGKPRGVKGALPWYAYHPDSQEVQIAISLLIKNHRHFTAEEVSRLWRFFEYNRIESETFHQRWWIKSLKLYGNVKEMRMQWESLRGGAEKAIGRVLD